MIDPANTRPRITIDNLDNLSKQELFDMSAHHILSTRLKSFNISTRTCSYSGFGCGAAPFLKSDYRELADSFGSWDSLVGCSWDGSIGISSARTSTRNFTISGHEHRFIRELQRCHDNAPEENFISEWTWKMRVLAEEYQLNSKVLYEN